MVRVSALQSVDLEFIFLVDSYQTTLKKMASTAFLLGAWHLGEVVETKLVSLLIVSLQKALKGTPHLFAEDRWPKHLGNGNSQASADVSSIEWLIWSQLRQSYEAKLMAYLSLIVIRWLTLGPKTLILRQGANHRFM